MNNLIPVGFYRETTRDEEEAQGRPNIRDAISDAPQEHEKEVVFYLQNSICVSALGCFLEDVLDPTSRSAIYGHIYTDGVFVWPLYAAYYVERYHLRLPSEFIQHMASRNWTPPGKVEMDLDALSITSVDHTRGR
jgi:hypothetical protein